jgi:hypothetical protein
MRRCRGGGGNGPKRLAWRLGREWRGPCVREREEGDPLAYRPKPDPDPVPKGAAVIPLSPPPKQVGPVHIASAKGRTIRPATSDGKISFTFAAGREKYVSG